MVERRSRDRRPRVRPEPIGAEATAPRCPSAAAALAVVTEESELALDTGLDPEADSVRAQEELQDWLEPRRTPVRQIPMDPGEFEWPPTPPELQRSSTPPRPATRRDTETSRGTAAGAPTPDEFREPALIIAPQYLPASERCDLEDAVELQLRQNWDPKLGWQGHLDRRDEAAKALRPYQPIQYPQPYRGKRSRATSEWTPESALQIRRERVRAREHRRATEREYQTLSARASESVRDRIPERRPVVTQESMLRPHLDSKWRRRNPNRQMTFEDHADHPRHVRRDDSSVVGPHNLAERRSSPPADEAFQEEVRHLAEEAARVTRLEDQSPPATATPPTSERQNPAPRRNSTPTSRPAPLRRVTRFQWLEALPLDEDDPPPHTCFRCWKSGHRPARCPAPKPWFHCFNCGRHRVAAYNCPRCTTAYALWEVRPAHEARFGPSATVTRPPQGPEMQTTPMEIEGVREQPHQSAAVSLPLSTPPPSATTGRQDERGPPRSPTPPPPSSATKDTGEPVRFLRRPHELPPVRDSGTKGTTTLPRTFPVLPQARRLESPAVEQSGVEMVAASAPDPTPARVTPKWLNPTALATWALQVIHLLLLIISATKTGRTNQTSLTSKNLKGNDPV
ncbi:hypothetical protein QAD02_008161 [Eretmocerus hayati]|uniref:Uncharacterized protein n=1 Tax=Eretmocerus hayati TaxID=131215 RepID=A0ACC2N839_9HYME|nr:hypothetical protein QAD02_008161 [Eretmocerus hayati]